VAVQRANLKDALASQLKTVRQLSWGRCVEGEAGVEKVVSKKNETIFGSCFGGDTVDGRNPAPPGMYETLQIMG